MPKKSDYKIINNNVVCIRVDEKTLCSPETYKFIDDDSIPWQTTEKEIVRLPDFSFIFTDDPSYLEVLKQRKKAEIAAARYEYEIAGVVFDGIHVTTDREDQAMITSVALSAVVDPTFTTVWKGADGYLDLDCAGVLTLARMVGTHVEDAFAEEKRLTELIEQAQDEQELAPIVWTLK